ncbi:zinc ribbon domain-containing protein [Saccharopolyspora sp. K220]|uniref:zinc ribbon domain-containing protein n=1 Tax=Saccharopolyspora soli TaxID=2926618 RepID=UPI001F599B03|nr:zinc ribbon domain-containing protein [Saccharopolyspora soli]MCI2423688.1 zinc ribbon domain-containing protein [Saccharopolyspora soli]
MSELPNVELEIWQQPYLATSEDELRAGMVVSVEETSEVELEIRIRLRLADEVLEVRRVDADPADLLATAERSAGSVDVPIGADWSGSRRYQLRLRVNAGRSPRDEDLQAATVSIVARPTGAALAHQVSPARAIRVHWFVVDAGSKSGRPVAEPDPSLRPLAEAVQAGCTAFLADNVDEAKQQWRVAGELARRLGAKDSLWRLSRLAADRPVGPRDLIEAGQVFLSIGQPDEASARCPDCGRIAMDYDRYCEQCGTRLHPVEQR